MRASQDAQRTSFSGEVLMIDPVWQLARLSLSAGRRNIDLKETCLAEEWVGAVAWSRALYQSPDQ